MDISAYMDVGNHPQMVQCGAPSIAKLVYNSNNYIVYSYNYS